MYARVRTYRIKQGQVDERLRYARESSIDAYKKQKGFQGVLILVDPDEHKNMTVGLWDTEADMLASERAEEAAEKSAHRSHASGEVTTEHFEIKDRSGGFGQCARVRTFQLAPGQVDAYLRNMREVADPYWTTVPGRKGRLILIDEASNKNITIAFFDNEANMLASETQPGTLAVLAGEPHITGSQTVEHFQVAHTE
jgi:heme-degrading monooxygenase HmoA